MKPSELRPGDKLLVTFGDDRQREATFVRRVPARAYQKAYSILHCPDFAFINGPDDSGYFTMPDAAMRSRATPLSTTHTGEPTND